MYYMQDEVMVVDKESFVYKLDTWDLVTRKKIFKTEKLIGYIELTYIYFL